MASDFLVAGSQLDQVETTKLKESIDDSHIVSNGKECLFLHQCGMLVFVAPKFCAKPIV